MMMRKRKRARESTCNDTTSHHALRHAGGNYPLSFHKDLADTFYPAASPSCPEKKPP